MFKTEKAADGKTKKLNVRKETRIEVTQAALAEYPIATIRSETVQFSSDPEEDGPRVTFHDYLMDLCNMVAQVRGVHRRSLSRGRVLATAQCQLQTNKVPSLKDLRLWG